MRTRRRAPFGVEATRDAVHTHHMTLDTRRGPKAPTHTAARTPGPLTSATWLGAGQFTCEKAPMHSALGHPRSGVGGSRAGGEGVHHGCSGQAGACGVRSSARCAALGCACDRKPAQARTARSEASAPPRVPGRRRQVAGNGLVGQGPPLHRLACKVASGGRADAVPHTTQRGKHGHGHDGTCHGVNNRPTPQWQSQMSQLQSRVTCHVSRVTCHVSRVTCHSHSHSHSHGHSHGHGHSHSHSCSCSHSHSHSHVSQLQSQSQPQSQSQSRVTVTVT
jgi:hypothetical protein